MLSKNALITGAQNYFFVSHLISSVQIVMNVIWPIRAAQKGTCQNESYESKYVVAQSQFCHLLTVWLHACTVWKVATLTPTFNSRRHHGIGRCKCRPWQEGVSPFGHTGGCGRSRHIVVAHVIVRGWIEMRLHGSGRGGGQISWVVIVCCL